MNSSLCSLQTIIKYQPTPKPTLVLTAGTNLTGTSYYMAGAISDDGKYIVYSRGGSNYIYYSTNGGTSFTQSNAPQGDWCQISADSTGQYLIAVALSLNYPYISSNYGQTWTSQTASQTTCTTNQWWGAFCSDIIVGTGLPIIMCSTVNTTQGCAISFNFGSSWSGNVTSGIGSGTGFSITGSRDGSTILICNGANTSTGQMTVSYNSGSSWALYPNNPTVVGYGRGVAYGNTSGTTYILYNQQSSSAGGTQVYNGSWTSLTTPNIINAGGKQSCVASSCSGKLMALNNRTTFKNYYSTNYGVTWSDWTTGLSYTNVNWYGVISSKNGKYIISLSDTTGLYLFTLPTTN